MALLLSRYGEQYVNLSAAWNKVLCHIHDGGHPWYPLGPPVGSASCPHCTSYPNLVHDAFSKPIMMILGASVI